MNPAATVLNDGEHDEDDDDAAKREGPATAPPERSDRPPNERVSEPTSDIVRVGEYDGYGMRGLAAREVRIFLWSVILSGRAFRSRRFE